VAFFARTADPDFICGVIRLAARSMVFAHYACAEELELRLADAKRRRAHALEINDNIVQGLMVALYSIDLGDEGQARQALDEQPMGPGDLVRRRAASVADRKPGESEGKDAASSG
jgi:hypothetical protein